MANSSVDPEILNSILPLKDLAEHGFQRAHQSGTNKPLDEDLKVLEEYARAMARNLYTDSYEPNQHPHHRKYEDQYQKYLEDLGDAKLAEGYAAANVAEREEELAKKQSGRQKPQMPIVIFVAAVTALALSIAPTLHDRFFLTLEDDALAWFVSMASASAIGVLIAWALLGAVSAVGKRTAGNFLGLIAGVGIGVGFWLLRISDAQETGEYVFASALTVIEISTVIFLDWLAIDFRKEYGEWAVYQEEINVLTAQLKVAQDHYTRRADCVRELEAKIHGHVRYVENLQVKHFKINELEDVAVKATLDGYYEGVRSNKGRLLGLRIVQSK